MGDYGYIPIFGVEPFKNVAGAPLTTVNSFNLKTTTFGGGANNTRNNLLVTLWGNLQFSETFSGTVLAGDLLQPVDASVEGSIAEILPGLANNGFSSFADSRTSFKLSFVQNSDEDPFVSSPLMGVLNPPGELKNAYKYLAKAMQVAISAGNPVGVLTTFKKSVLDLFMWRGAFCTTGSSIAQITALSGTLAAGNIFFLPLLKTSGADGVLPVFYPSLLLELIATGDVDAVNVYLTALAAGDFFVPVFFSPTATPASGAAWFAEITWPHSTPR